MTPIDRHIQEIMRLKKVINETKSTYLKNDYSKRISQMIKELREYCDYRGYDFTNILKRIDS